MKCAAGKLAINGGTPVRARSWPAPYYGASVLGQEELTLLAEVIAARPGLEYWCYPNDISGENDHTPVAGARMTYGFGFWRSGFKRLIPWMYQASSGDPLNYLDGHTMDFFVRPDFDGTPIPVGLWDGFREGYDDMRYIYSLERAIAVAQESQSERVRAEAAEGRKTLDTIWKAIPVAPQYQYRGFWSPDEMDVYRWMIAERLERLTKMMRP